MKWRTQASKVCGLPGDLEAFLMAGRITGLNGVCTYMESLSFPQSPEALTAAWLTDIMQSSAELPSNIQVQTFSVEPVGEIVGVIGEVVRIRLNYSATCQAPSSVVIKFAHRNPENRAIANNTRMYEREVMFFNEIASHIDTPLTRCYFAEMDLSTGGNAVVIEDLIDYRVGDQVTGINLAQVKMVVDTIAPLHARFYGRWQQDFGHMMSIDSDEYIDSFLPGFLGSWEMAIKNFPACFPKILLDAMPAYVDGLGGIMKMMGERTMTFIHGDVRMDNAMFGQGGPGQQPVIMIDWQNMMISNPLQDLAWLAATSLKVEVRRAIEEDMLGYYYEAMKGHGVSGYSLAQVRADYDIAVLFMMNFNMIIAGAFVPSSERAREMAVEGLHRAVEAVLDRDLLRYIPD
ncbi:MAG: DUF1679 domain-containing protein [Pseudomonadales bacterium]|nr:DUF1679 domain-containing protein [Pseudomonadales bacterium]